MKIVLKDGRRYVLSFKLGEDYITELRSFLLDQNINSAFFFGIGGASFLQLGFYNSDSKNYDLKEYRGSFEVLNLSGNVSTSNGEIVIHSHGSFSGEDMLAFGGHVFGLKVKPTLELSLISLEGSMERTQDPEIGLKLLG